jgi:hypothetical protein
MRIDVEPTDGGSLFFDALKSATDAAGAGLVPPVTGT